jgi:hypothetical protein
LCFGISQLMRPALGLIRAGKRSVVEVSIGEWKLS